MAINPETQFVGKITASSSDYPYGEARDITLPGDGTGTPWKAVGLNDIFGMQQALLKMASIVPSGTPEKVSASQYLQALVELASGRAINYDESGIADAYVLDVQTNQYAPDSLFDGLFGYFTPGNDNTGASTINFAGTGVKALVTWDGIALPSGYLGTERVKIIYNLSSDHFRLDKPTTDDYIKLSEVQSSGVDGGGATTAIWDPRVLNTEDNDLGGHAAIVGSDQFTLVAGTYRIKASAPAHAVNQHKIRLENITDTATTIIGSSHYAPTGSGSYALLSGEFTIAATKTFELQHRVNTSKITDGLGVSSTFGVSEVYTVIELWKID